MTEWHELVTVMAGFLASSFAILKLALGQHRLVMEKFLGFFEESSKQQAKSVDDLRVAVDSLSEGVRENSHLLQYLTEWLQVGAPAGRP